MKTVYKDGISRSVLDTRLQDYLDAGWKLSADSADEEVLVLRPPVKSKGTVKLSLDNANKGD